MYSASKHDIYINSLSILFYNKFYKVINTLFEYCNLF